MIITPEYILLMKYKEQAPFAAYKRLDTDIEIEQEQIVIRSPPQLTVVSTFIRQIRNTLFFNTINPIKYSCIVNCENGAIQVEQSTLTLIINYLPVQTLNYGKIKVFIEDSFIYCYNDTSENTRQAFKAEMINSTLCKELRDCISFYQTFNLQNIQQAPESTSVSSLCNDGLRISNSKKGIRISNAVIASQSAAPPAETSNGRPPISVESSNPSSIDEQRIKEILDLQSEEYEREQYSLSQVAPKGGEEAQKVLNSSTLMQDEKIEEADAGPENQQASPKSVLNSSSNIMGSSQVALPATGAACELTPLQQEAQKYYNQKIPMRNFDGTEAILRFECDGKQVNVQITPPGASLQVQSLRIVDELESSGVLCLTCGGTEVFFTLEIARCAEMIRQYKNLAFVHYYKPELAKYSIQQSLEILSDDYQAKSPQHEPFYLSLKTANCAVFVQRNEGCISKLDQVCQMSYIRRSEDEMLLFLRRESGATTLWLQRQDAEKLLSAWEVLISE